MYEYMKKNRLLIIIFMLSLAVSGCGFTGDQNKVVSEKDLSHNPLSGTDDQAVAQRIRDLNTGLTPKVKPTGKNSGSYADGQSQSGQGGTQGNTDEQRQVKLEDLASQYAQAILKTNMGDIKLMFFNSDAVLTVNNFMNLAKAGFYNGTKFHRVMKDFMIQGGDPLSKDSDWSDDGTGGPGYQFQDEINSHKLVRGALAMANSGPHTNGSQFFIVTAASTPWLDGKHTVFGQVVDGMDIVDKIEKSKVDENSHPTTDVIIQGIELVK